ncbi:MAG: DMT family transporter [Phycisphaerae bacterium]
MRTPSDAPVAPTVIDAVRVSTTTANRIATDPSRPERTAISRRGAGGALINAALLAGYVLIGGITPVAAKDALSELPAIATGVMRFGIAASLLLLTRLFWRERSEAAVRPIERRDHWRFLLAGLLSVPVNQPCYLLGLHFANASHGGLFYAVNPVLVYLFTVAIGWTRWSTRMIAACVLAFAGTAVIGIDGLHTGGSTRFLVGDALLFCAVSSWAAYSIVIVPLAATYGPIRSLTICMTIGALLYLPAFAIDGGQVDFARLSARALGGFLFISVMTGYLNYVIYFIALTRMEVNRISISANTGPLVAVVAAHYWRDEPISAWLSISLVILVAAITLANWDRIKTLAGRRRPAPA